ncbi:MAG: hypothetical protein WBK55_10395 [Alphaproteobacteria bacterium]
MFSKKTVFILGAGASWHYGYPTGEELVEEIIRRSDELIKNASSYRYKASAVPQYIVDIMNEEKISSSHAWDKFTNDCKSLKEKLSDINPLVIDYFLGRNKALQKIGKLLIAWIILEREQNYFNLKANINHRNKHKKSPYPANHKKGDGLILKNFKDNWLRFITEKMLTGCDSFEELKKRNHVNFITFNYDISLERILYNNFCGIETINGSNEDIGSFFSSDRVIHLYGQVSENFKNFPILKIIDDEVSKYVNVTREEKWDMIFLRQFNAAYKALSGINIIDPGEKKIEAF